MTEYEREKIDIESIQRQHHDISLHQQKRETLFMNHVLSGIKKLGAKLSKDGDMYCFLYGENLQEGIAGFGKTPMLAAYAFAKEFGL